MEAFTGNASQATGYGNTILITSSGTATFYAVGGKTLKLSVRSNAVYFQWGKKDNTTPTASGTAATQMDWLPQNSVTRMSKPEFADGIWILQDTGAAQVFATPGQGI